MISFCFPRNHRKLPAAITTADATYCSISPRTECESRVQAIRCCLCAHDQLSKKIGVAFLSAERSASCLRQCDTCLEERLSRLVRPQDDRGSWSSRLHGAFERLRRATGSGVTLHVVAPFFFSFLGGGLRHGQATLLCFHGCQSNFCSTEAL